MEKLEEFKQFLLGLLPEARELDKRASTNVARAFSNGQLRILEVIAVFVINSIKQGEIDMEKAKSEIKVLSQGVIKEIGRKKQDNPVNDKLIELAKTTKLGGFQQIDPELISPSKFETTVFNLRRLGHLEENVKPKRNVNGVNGLFLVRLTEAQMENEPKKRQQRTRA